MNDGKLQLSKGMAVTVYLYLALPIAIFLLGWCKWYIGVPLTVLMLWAIVLSIREHKFKPRKAYVYTSMDKIKIAFIIGVVLLWVVASGVGNFVWQNSDHQTRNGIFNAMVEHEWPVAYEIATENGIELRSMVYYIGFWFPSALMGKLFGLEVGYTMQVAWAAIGVLIAYALICCWRRKIMVWPLFVFIFFSGLDAVGIALSQVDSLQIWGSNHLEAWSVFYQFSSMTTQLFWVFNQAVPAWVAAIFVLLYERPKNMIFTVSMLLLSSAFPCVGLLPFAIYLMIKRSVWSASYKKATQVMADCWKNWGSKQNILVGILLGVVSSIYLLGNNAMLEEIVRTFGAGIDVTIILIVVVAILAAVGLFWLLTTIVLKGGGGELKIVAAFAGIYLLILKIQGFGYNDWQSPVFWWFVLTVFFFLEAGIFLVWLYPMVDDKKLIWISAISLYVIPTIYIGKSCDFCMRASIPGLLLIILWCIQCIDEKKDKIKVYVLIGMLVIGAITPLHEMKRTYVNTMNYYENYTLDEESVLRGKNFSGSVESFFWKYIAK